VSSSQRISEIFLDERGIVRRSPQVEHEHKVAIYDLLQNNHFHPVADGGDGGQGLEGPYVLHLSIVENRLIFDIRDEKDKALAKFALPLNSFRSIVRDYFMICDSYFKAIKTSAPSRIEAIDMGRRGIHNEGSELLRELLADKVEIDANTARRLFTLICVLHIKA
jgi:uncharacterized protein (UPF0262 family)